MLSAVVEVAGGRELEHLAVLEVEVAQTCYVETDGAADSTVLERKVELSRPSLFVDNGEGLSAIEWLRDGSCSCAAQGGHR